MSCFHSKFLLELWLDNHVLCLTELCELPNNEVKFLHARFYASRFLCRLIETLNSWFVSGTHLPLCLTAPRKFLNNEVEGSHVQTYLHLPNLGWFQTLEILNLSLSFSLYSRPEVWPRSDFGLKQFCDTGRSSDYQQSLGWAGTSQWT